MLRGEKGGTELGICMFVSLHLTAHMCHDWLIIFKGLTPHPLLSFATGPKPQKVCPTYDTMLCDAL